MAIEKLDRALQDFPLLQGMSPEHAQMLAECASDQQVEAGDFLFKEGEPARYFYLIREGKLALEIHGPTGPIPLETLSEGEVAGWSWSIPPYKYRFDARAIENTRLVALDGERIRAHCDSNPALGLEILKRFSAVLAHRLEATRLRLMDLYGKPHAKGMP